MITQLIDDAIYLEPGSVWRRGDSYQQIVTISTGNVFSSTFRQKGNFETPVKDWLTWAKHPDTVLVYSPSGNKLPPNPVAGCEVTLIKHSKNGVTLKIGANDFVHIALFADHEGEADELAAYLKACLERGNE